jgi:S-DNA-T family DNA segregation ATPase FtsK/SpoIIIE
LPGLRHDGRVGGGYLPTVSRSLIRYGLAVRTGAPRPFGVDLAGDGLHGLVPGTTGAGKSELLQILIASLACASRPDEMTFVLVGYKGGSAFKGCVHLPHATGVVTGLEVYLTQRALASLSAELTRRKGCWPPPGPKT